MVGLMICTYEVHPRCPNQGGFPSANTVRSAWLVVFENYIQIKWEKAEVDMKSNKITYYIYSVYYLSVNCGYLVIPCGSQTWRAGKTPPSSIWQWIFVKVQPVWVLEGKRYLLFFCLHFMICCFNQHFLSLLKNLTLSLFPTCCPGNTFQVYNPPYFCPGKRSSLQSSPTLVTLQAWLCGHRKVLCRAQSAEGTRNEGGGWGGSGDGFVGSWDLFGHHVQLFGTMDNIV